ncbi:MAG TPA: alpha/beta hydrolase [Streptosporangiaceae bacterium]
MPYATVGEENSGTIELYYEDHGSGRPVVLIHAYALSGRAWDKQVPVLLEDGHRVITYDRRGFGKSSQPMTGYDYDTFASDLRTLLETLDLRDLTLVGHSMGTGEVTRYLGRYGSARVARAVLVSPIPPFLLQTPDNPEGVPAAYQASWNIAASASATAAVDCIRTWQTDFRADLSKIDVPMLVIQGNDDQAVPYPKSGQRLPGLINDLQLVVIDGGPHAIPWTHAGQVNAALLSFIGAHAAAPAW